MARQRAPPARALPDRVIAPLTQLVAAVGAQMTTQVAGLDHETFFRRLGGDDRLFGGLRANGP